MCSHMHLEAHPLPVQGIVSHSPHTESSITLAWTFDTKHGWQQRPWIPTPCRLEGFVPRIFRSLHMKSSITLAWIVDTKHGRQQRPRVPNWARHGPNAIKWYRMPLSSGTLTLARHLHSLHRPHGNALKGVSNGCRSPPSPSHPPNGMPSSKSNGSWMDLGMGMVSFQIGSSNEKGVDR